MKKVMEDVAARVCRGEVGAEDEKFKNLKWQKCTIAVAVEIGSFASLRTCEAELHGRSTARIAK